MPFGFECNSFEFLQDWQQWPHWLQSPLWSHSGRGGGSGRSGHIGRAGRTGPGHCYRMYSQAEFENIFDEIMFHNCDTQGGQMNEAQKILSVDNDFSLKTPKAQSNVCTMPFNRFHISINASKKSIFS